jgi:diguanylate cyclase (GGDEF)-like protein
MSAFRPRSWRAQEDHPLAAFRERAVYVLAFATLIVLLPFAVNNFVQGRVVVGIGTAVIVLIFAVDAVAIYRRRRPPVPLQLLVVPALPTILVAAKQQGFGPILWCYPALLILFFAVSRPVANLVTLAMLAALTPLSLQSAGPQVTVRLLVTVTLIAVFANVLLGLIADLHQRLIEQAITDPLTGAFNRRHMEARLAETLARCRRVSQPASLILADIDYFKGVNDRFGHARGDEVLQRVVAVLTAQKRLQDVLFRIGGEEFLLLLTDTTEADAVAMADRLRGSIGRDATLAPIQLTLSLGVAGLRAGDSTSTWLRGADEALYLSKQRGRDRTSVRPPS